MHIFTKQWKDKYIKPRRLNKMRKLILALLLITSPLLIAAVYSEYSEVGETIGEVVNLNGNYLHVIGEPLTPAGKHDIVVNIRHAPIYNLLTGFPAKIADIKPDMSIRIAYVHTGDKAEAIAVWLNCDYEESAVFTVVVSDNIQYGHEYSTFLSADGKYRVTLSHKTSIIDPYMGELSPLDIAPGMEFFIWVDMITASSPSLVYPSKVVLIND